MEQNNTKTSPTAANSSASLADWGALTPVESVILKRILTDQMNQAHSLLCTQSQIPALAPIISLIGTSTATNRIWSELRSYPGAKSILNAHLNGLPSKMETNLIFHNPFSDSKTWRAITAVCEHDDGTFRFYKSVVLGEIKKAHRDLFEIYPLEGAKIDMSMSDALIEVAFGSGLESESESS